MSVEDLIKEIKKLSTQKGTQCIDLPVKILKDIFGNNICDFFNNCVDKGNLPSVLKFGNITPVFKKECRGSKGNY